MPVRGIRSPHYGNTWGEGRRKFALAWGGMARVARTEHFTEPRIGVIWP